MHTKLSLVLNKKKTKKQSQYKMKHSIYEKFRLNLSHFQSIKNHDVKIIGKTVNIKQNDKSAVAVNDRVKGQI